MRAVAICFPRNEREPILMEKPAGLLAGQCGHECLPQGRKILAKRSRLFSPGLMASGSAATCPSSRRAVEALLAGEGNTCPAPGSATMHHGVLEPLFRPFPGANAVHP